MYFEKEIILGFVVLVFMLTWLSLYFYDNRKNVATRRLVIRANSLSFYVDRLLTILPDMEANQHGYITGDSAFPAFFYKVGDSVLTRLQEFQFLVQYKMQQQKRLQKLRGIGIDGAYVKSWSTVFDITSSKKASCLDNVNAEGLRVVNVIMSNATKMGIGINKLLDFSRVGKRDIVKFPYNIEHMRHNRASESNALNYTQKTISTEIEIVLRYERNKVIYNVNECTVGRVNNCGTFHFSLPIAA